MTTTCSNNMFTKKIMYQLNKIKLTCHSVRDNGCNDLWNNEDYYLERYKQWNEYKWNNVNNNNR